MPERNEDDREFMSSYIPGSDLNTGLGRGFPDDEALKVTVTDALTWDEQVEATRIQVIAHNTVITLMGTVESEDERERAEELARGVSGVGEVVNALEVTGEQDEAPASLPHRSA